ncbi:MAG: hypothetical protein ACI8ZT_000753 [Bacteroidia bacterium]|jgi:hypothetical protein
MVSANRGNSRWQLLRNRTIAPTTSAPSLLRHFWHPWILHNRSGEERETVFESIRIRDDADEPTWMYTRRLSKIVTGCSTYPRPVLTEAIRDGNCSAIAPSLLQQVHHRSYNKCTIAPTTSAPSLLHSEIAPSLLRFDNSLVLAETEIF